MFENASNFKIDGGTFISVSGQSGIDKLYDHSARGAAYDSFVAESKASCLEGTRTQYIEDITTWMTGMDQVRQQRVLWMYGPAGVGKSAVAKSCAIKAAELGVLGASFFFSRDNGVNDPARFFPTIVYQLATKMPEYKSIVGRKVEADLTLLEKGLDAQFRQLIVAPFLQLEAQGVPIAPKIIFVDGLDECNLDTAQAKFVELVATSAVGLGDGIPLLWAFFSRPERHLEQAFSQFSNTSLFWQIELPVSRDHDADIRLYLRSALRLSGSSSDIGHLSLDVTAWPSNHDLDTLVKMIAGLFIYAAAIVRFIMDPDALGPERRLEQVISLCRSQQSPLPSTLSSTITPTLDAFYAMIMARIPSSLLTITQQILLVLHEVQEPYGLKRALISPAFFLSLTMREVEHVLSKLHSVLTLRPREKDQSEGKEIFFYHASFMEYVLDQNRSKEYCIADKRNYDVIATRILQLRNDLHAMNGLSMAKKSPMRRQLTLISSSNQSSMSAQLQFPLGYLYHTLRTYTLRWVAYSGQSAGIMEMLRSDIVDISRPLIEMNWQYKGLLPEEIVRLHSLSKSRGMRWQHLRPLKPDLAELPKPWSTTAPVEDLWENMAPLLRASRSSVRDQHITSCANVIRTRCEDTESSLYIQSKLTGYFSLHLGEVSHKLTLENLDDFEMVVYFYYEWHEYWYDCNFRRLSGKNLPDSITKVALSCWRDFFLRVEGNDHRLTRAVLSLVERRRNGDWLPYLLPDGSFRLLFAYFRTLQNDPALGSQYQQAKGMFLQAAKEHYVVEPLFCPDRDLLTNLGAVRECIDSEAGDANILYYPWDLVPGMQQSCAEASMEGHWDEAFALFEKDLVTDSKHSRSKTFDLIGQVCQHSPSAVIHIREIFREYMKKDAPLRVAHYRLEKHLTESEISSRIQGHYCSLIDYAWTRCWKDIYGEECLLIGRLVKEVAVGGH